MNWQTFFIFRLTSEPCILVSRFKIFLSVIHKAGNIVAEKSKFLIEIRTIALFNHSVFELPGRCAAAKW